MEEQIQQIKDALQQLLQLWIQMGSPFSDEIQLALAQVMEHAANRILELRSAGGGAGIPPTPPDNGIKQAMPSSNVEGFAYDDKTGQLMVRFLGEHPNRNGPVYAYSGIPKEIFALFQKGAIPARTDGQNKWGKWWKGKVPSIGASLYTLIKERGYPYKKLS